MQRAYISKLMEIAEKDNRVMHLVADSGTGFDEMFRRNFPSQMYNFGIAEEHMVAAAAGLATAEKIPFVFTAGAFLAYRAFEFIRDDVCFNNLNVKVVGMGSGLAWSTLGPSHHTTEDIAVLRSIPGLRILSPATPVEVAACVELAYKYYGPVYIRIGMNNEREFFDENYQIAFGKNNIVKAGKDIAVFSTGSILEEVCEAAQKMNALGIDAEVINVTSVKPFDVDSVMRAANDFALLVTVEEHNVIGGLGGIVSEVIAERGLGKKVLKIGLNDKFATGYGTQRSVREENGLDSNSIVERIVGAYNERL